MPLDPPLAATRRHRARATAWAVALVAEPHKAWPAAVPAGPQLEALSAEPGIPEVKEAVPAEPVEAGSEAAHLTESRQVGPEAAERELVLVYRPVALAAVACNRTLAPTLGQT